MLGKNMLSMSGLSLYRNAVQFGMNIVITAFVAPAEYGLIVFTTPFIVLIALLTDLGLTSAITRAPELGRRTAGAAFTVTLALGLVLAAVLAAAAFPLQAALDMAGLGQVMTGMALAVVLSVGASMPRALQERQLAYTRIASIEAAAVLIGACIGLVAAWRGAGVLGLVLYNIVNHGLRAAAFGWLSRRELQLNTEWRSLTGLLSFGGWVLASNLLSFLQRNSDNLLIGATLGAATVGIYGLAYQFMLAPVMAITWPTSAILLATLRDAEPGSERARRMVSAVIAITSMLSVPAMVYLTFGLGWLVQAVLSPRWASVSAVVMWLAPLGALQSIASYNGAVLMVAGRARAQFGYTVVTTIVLVATFIVALPFGLMTFVKAYVAVSTVLSLLYLWVIARLTGLGWRGLFRSVGPALFATAAALLAAGAGFGFRQASWGGWLGATLTYMVVVLGVFLLMRTRIRTSFTVLMARAA